MSNSITYLSHRLAVNVNTNINKKDRWDNGTPRHQQTTLCDIQNDVWAIVG